VGRKGEQCFIWDRHKAWGWEGRRRTSESQKDEETQAQNKIPLVPLSLACPFANLLTNLGLLPHGPTTAHQGVAEMGDRDGGEAELPKGPFPLGAPAGPQVLDLNPICRQAVRI